MNTVFQAAARHAWRQPWVVATAAVLGLAAVAAAPQAQAADIGVSIGISQPGVYGRIDIGRFPQPAVVVSQPVLVAPPVRYVAPAPVYLWVPPHHQQHWSRHCQSYGACGVPVYFVQDGWYRQHVMAPPPPVRVYPVVPVYGHRDGYREGYREGRHDGRWDRGGERWVERGYDHGPGRGDWRRDDRWDGRHDGHGERRGRDDDQGGHRGPRG